MNIKTITTVDGVNTVDFGNTPDRFYWVKNIGTTTVYVSANSNIIAGGDGVAELSAGSMVMIEDYRSKIYVLGAGRVEIHETDVPFCPFKSAPVDNGGGANIVGDNLLINPDFRINQRGISGTFSETGKYFADRWRLVSGSVTVNADGSITLNGSICQPLENPVGGNVTASVSAGSAVYDDVTKTFTVNGNGDVISWAKLEYGNTSTAFIPPDPAAELLKCRRYYRTLDRGITAYAVNSTSVVFVAAFDIPMRNVNPSMQILNAARLCWSNGWLDTPDVSDLSIVSVNRSNMGICYVHVGGFNVTLNGTAFDTNYSFRSATDNFICIDAEIY